MTTNLEVRTMCVCVYIPGYVHTCTCTRIAVDYTCLTVTLSSFFSEKTCAYNYKSN